MITVFIQDWFALLKLNDPGSSWLSNYPAPSPQLDRCCLVSNVNLYHPNTPPAEIDLLVEDIVLGVGEPDSDGNINTDSGDSDTTPNHGSNAGSNNDSDTV